jgi:hypothetical protein
MRSWHLRPLPVIEDIQLTQVRPRPGFCEPCYRVNTAAANTTVSISNDTPATDGERRPFAPASCRRQELPASHHPVPPRRLPLECVAANVTSASAADVVRVQAVIGIGVELRLVPGTNHDETSSASPARKKGTAFTR